MICPIHGDFGAHFNECPQCQPSVAASETPEIPDEPSYDELIQECILLKEQLTSASAKLVEVERERDKAVMAMVSREVGTWFAEQLADKVKRLAVELNAARAEIARLNEQLNLLQK